MITGTTESHKAVVQVLTKFQPPIRAEEVGKPCIYHKVEHITLPQMANDVDHGRLRLLRATAFDDCHGIWSVECRSLMGGPVSEF